VTGYPGARRSGPGFSLAPQREVRREQRKAKASPDELGLLGVSGGAVSGAAALTGLIDLDLADGVMLVYVFT